MKSILIMVGAIAAAGASVAAAGNVACNDDCPALVPTAAPQPPEWFLTEVARMVNDGDRWIADNAAYRSDEEPWERYGMEWTRAADGNGAEGRLFGLLGGEERQTFWRMRLTWDEERKVARMWQEGGGGIVGDGTMKPTGRGIETEAIQTFTQADGTTFEVRHLSTTTEDTHVTRSFDRVNGEWQPRREYVWKKLPR